MTSPLGGIDAVSAALQEQGYLASRALATVIHLGAQLEQPVLIEGEAGVGKTSVATALAAATGARLVRLQCHEGLDAHQALYDWDYAKQMVMLRQSEISGSPAPLYSRDYLVRRPLLEALEHEGAVVLLIDEIDRADEAFEALLLELLSEFQVTIPELGTIRAPQRPFVVLTSNRTRELHDALKRRCLYHWLDYPSPAEEQAIVRRRVPDVPQEIADRVCGAVARLRREELYKAPGVGETIAWAKALMTLGPGHDLDGTLGVVLKVHEDIERVREGNLLHER